VSHKEGGVLFFIIPQIFLGTGTGTWLKYHGTTVKLGGKKTNKPQPAASGKPIYSTQKYK
jgi:hypothetical protein